MGSFTADMSLRMFTVPFSSLVLGPPTGRVTPAELILGSLAGVLKATGAR